MTDKIKVVTPSGHLMYVNVTGKGKENFNQDGFDFVASVVLDKTKKTTVDFIAELNKIYKTKHQEGKTLRSMPFKYCDKDGNAKNEKGEVFTEANSSHIIVNAKTKTTFGDGAVKKINIKNAKAQNVELLDRKIGNGSIGAISGIAGYYVNGRNDGLSFYLNAVQLLKFIEYKQDDGFAAQDGDFEGFSDEETGFEQVDELPKEQARPSRL